MSQLPYRDRTWAVGPPQPLPKAPRLCVDCGNISLDHGACVKSIKGQEPAIMSEGHGREMIIPTTHYCDAAAPIKWLCGAFGFEERRVAQGENRTTAHTELTLGLAVIMLGTANDNESERLTSPPADTGGVPKTPYIIVADVDADHERAKAAGAEIVVPLKQETFGRVCTRRRPEGHQSNFGDYDPWNTAAGEGAS